jgi:zinc D-Ala-D-Ala carboxypeptidase
VPTPLTRNFSLEEMTFSQTAARHGILNAPDEAKIASLRALCENVLQPLRDALNLPITVSSGFRCAALNRAVGGATHSQHMEGEAADIICPAMSTDALFKRMLELNLPFDQLIYEGGKESVWVHVSFRAADRRRVIMRATFPPEGGVQYATLTRGEALVLQA